MREPSVLASTSREGAGRERPPSGWAEHTRAPWPAPPWSGPLASLACGAPDAALTSVARRLAEVRARGGELPEPDVVVAWLRASGEPHPRPRVVAAVGRDVAADPSVRARIDALRAPLGRCGVASAKANATSGEEAVVAVAVEALADLAPLPVRARTGEWLSLEASLHVPAVDAKLLVNGPHGAPRTVPTSFDRVSGAVRARFAVDRPGAFTAQLIADTDQGPRPVLEARIFADVEPPESDTPPAAPGEDVFASGDDAAQLARMIEALRTREPLPALVRDSRLDAIARAHAERMRAAGAVAHDIGDGDQRQRFAEAGLDALRVGENVARADTPAHVHRALYASPSHRLELLRPDSTHVGDGAARAADGSLYACEVFARDLR
jgi:uncharacterized protein YkwD